MESSRLAQIDLIADSPKQITNEPKAPLATIRLASVYLTLSMAVFTSITGEQNPLEYTESKAKIRGKVYHAGSLQYTSRGLIALCFWLLWGDFAFTFFESIFSKFIPLYLKNLEASNSLIGIMTGSIAGVVNIFFLPHISSWSDNYRSRWGRRIPFLYVATPLVVASLIGIGFAPEIAGWFYANLVVHITPSVTLVSVTLAFLCTLVVFFHFFNMVLVNAYNWLLRDVIPIEVIPIFLSWFRVVSTLSSSLFLWYVFPYVVSHRREVCTGVGLFYLVAFLIMCFRVNEGESPPPAPVEDRLGIIKSFATYFRDCLARPIYRNFIIVFVLTSAASACSTPFSILFNRDTLGLSLDDMGNVFAWNGALCAVLFPPVGWLCKKFSCLRVAMAGIIGQMVGSVCMLFFATDKTSFLVITVLLAFPTVAWALGSLSLTMELFPKRMFGQLSSGLNIFSCGALIFGNYLCGKFMDLLQSNYRMIFIWNILLISAAIYPMMLLYRSWKQNRGSWDDSEPISVFLCNNNLPR